MALYTFVITQSIILIGTLFLASDLEKPSFVRVHVNESTLKAMVTWQPPKDTSVTYIYVALFNSERGNMLFYGYKNMSLSQLIINKRLKNCTEYTVKLCFVYKNDKRSENVLRKILISGYKYTTNIKRNITVAWNTSLDNNFKVILPSRNKVFGVVPSGRINKGFSDNSTNMYLYRNKMNNLIKITLEQVRKSDAGLYRTVSMSDSRTESCLFLVVTDKPKTPKISIHPKQPFVGDNVTFTCKSTVQRWPENLQSSLSYTYAYTGSNGFIDRDDFVITDLSRRQKGQNVTCNAIDDHELVSNTSNVISINPFYGPESLEIRPYEQNVAIIEGESLGSIACTANCNPPCEMKWCTNATKRLRKLDPKSNLNMVHITRDQSGTYSCTAFHEYDRSRATTKYFKVDVQYPPRITDIRLNKERYFKGKPFTLHQSKSLQITVCIDGNPDSRVYFSRTGTNNKAINVTRKHHSYTFHYFGLRCEDSGHFNLLVENGIKHSSNRTVQLDVQCEPRDILFERKVVGTIQGAVEKITLSLVANPKPFIQWNPQTNYKWTLTEIGTNKYNAFSNLEIVNEHSFGIYRVEISNMFGHAVHNISIKAEGKPDSPKNLTLKELSHNLASISFVAGFDGGMKQTFTIEVIPIDTTIANVIREEIVANDTKKDVALSHTIQDLLPSTRYNVTITATNNLGSCSTFIEITTNNEPDYSISALLTTPAVLFGGGIGIPIAIIIIVISFLIKYKRRQNSNNVDNSDYKVQIGDMGSSYQNEGVGDEYACVSKVTKKSKGNKIETRLEENNEYAEVDKSNRIKGSITEGSKDANCDFTSEKSDGTETSQRPVRTQNADGLLYIEVDFTNPKSSKNRTPVIHGANERTDYVDIDFTRRADYSPDAEIKNNENSEHET